MRQLQSATVATSGNDLVGGRSTDPSLGLDDAPAAIRPCRVQSIAQPGMCPRFLVRFDGDIGVVVARPGLLYRMTQRVFDIGFSCFLLVVFVPAMVCLALVIKLSEPGAPVLYRSQRIGQTGEFGAWKFRSMKDRADVELQHLLASDDSLRTEYERYGKLHNDPRITRLGRIIRTTSLDELPQLFNVLCGEMSVVGPRPKLPMERERFGDALVPTLLCRPGLTGLWQVSGRNDVTFDERIRLDVAHAANASLTFDLVILIKTVKMLVRPGTGGAY